jgi:hypothetical protein
MAADLFLEHESPTTSRKGWAPLRAFAKQYRLADGRYVAIRCFEDIDYVEKFNAEYAGVELESETHEANHGGSRQQSAEPKNPGAAEAITYIANYTGNWGFILDLRADRRFGSKYFRLSDRQVEVVLASKAREAAWAQERQQKAVAAVASPVVKDGMYRKDGTIFKVQRAVNGSGNLYAKELVIDGPGDGRFEYAPGAIRRLSASDAMTVEEAAEFGRLYGVCCVCGRTLTDEQSIAAGIGPVCSGRGFAA